MNLWPGPLLAIALATVSCDGGDTSVRINSRPQVAVAASVTEGVGPLTVQHFATVVGGNGVLTFSWDFGDGESSSIENPLHTYAGNAGSYAVTLEVTDEDGDVGRSNIAITVAQDELPMAAATVSPSIAVAPAVVLFDCTATGGNAPLRYRWHFGDGSTAAGSQVNHSYFTAGTYLAECTVRDADGDVSTATEEIRIGDDEQPVIAVTAATPVTGQAPLDVSLQAQVAGGNAPVAVAWDFGDGSVGTGLETNHSFTSAGVHVVTATVSDVDGDSASAVLAITVSGAQEPIADAVITSGQCAVPGQTHVGLDASASSDPDGDAVSFNWFFVSRPAGSSATIDDAQQASASFVPDRAGDYQVAVSVSDGVNAEVSPPLSLSASGPSSIVRISGDAQSAQVGLALPAQAVVEVQNACGAVVANQQVRWAGDNAIPSVLESTTSASGRTAVSVTLGTSAGSAQLSASAAGASTAFTFLAEAGPAARLMMDAADQLLADNTLQSVTFRVTDEFGNQTDDVDVTFDVAIDALGATSAGLVDCSGSIKSVVGLATAAGVATLAVCAAEADDSFVAISNLSVAGLTAAGTVTLFSDDMDRDDPSWIANAPIGNPWQRGVPEAATGIPDSRTSAPIRGTVLDGPLSVGSGESFTVLSRPFDLSYPAAIESLRLSFDHYVDIEDCAEAALYSVCPTCTRLDPVGGYGSGCFFGPGFSGSVADWQRVHYDLSSLAGTTADLHWTLTWGTSVSGAGWYLDDVRVEATVAVPRIRFVGGAPTDLQAAADRDGVAQSCSAAIASATVSDVNGNPARDGTVVSFDSATPGLLFVAATEGSLISGANTSSVQVETIGGRAAVLATSSGAAGVASVDVAVASAGIGEALALPFTSTFAESCSDGIDSDCDGNTDCADADCVGDAACTGPAEVCLNGADDDGDGLADCEDSTCKGTAACQSGANATDTCNGIDDDSSGSIDEAACACVALAGCDDLVTGGPFAYVCHPGGSAVDFCFADCRDFDWCGSASPARTCNTATGVCALP